MYSIKQYAAMIGRSKSFVRSWVRSGKIPAIKIKDRYYVYDQSEAARARIFDPSSVPDHYRFLTAADVSRLSGFWGAIDFHIYLKKYPELKVGREDGRYRTRGRKVYFSIEDVRKVINHRRANKRVKNPDDYLKFVANRIVTLEYRPQAFALGDEMQNLLQRLLTAATHLPKRDQEDLLQRLREYCAENLRLIDLLRANLHSR